MHHRICTFTLTLLTHVIVSSQSLQVRASLPPAQGRSRVRRVRAGVRAVRSGVCMCTVQQPTDHAFNISFTLLHFPPHLPTLPSPPSTTPSSTSNVEVQSRHTSHVTRHMSHVTRHTSHVSRHMSHVTRHTSHVTRHPQILRLSNQARV